MRAFGVAAVAAVAVAAPAAIFAGTTTLEASVGPGNEIVLTKGGVRVTAVPPDVYFLRVDDRSESHSFHLRGPGVEIATGVGSTGTETFAISLVNGTYTYFCDEHPTQMRGTFRAGSPPPPPPRPTRLRAAVGPGARIVLRKSGVIVKTLKAGRYAITVVDRTASDNFHLRGRGVDRRTGVAAKGRVVWNVTLRRGALYTFWSDAHRTMRGTVRVT
jgi:plastocyanin